MLPILLATYGTVFLAEIVGDKLLYTTGVLATRFRWAPILCGMALAFMLKMGVAVAVGKAISTLPPWLVATITALNFFAIAFVLWRKPDKREVKPKDYPAHHADAGHLRRHFLFRMGRCGANHRGHSAWLGQYQFAAPLAVWIGAVLAMVTKGALAASIGARVRGWIQRTFARGQSATWRWGCCCCWGRFRCWKL